MSSRVTGWSRECRREGTGETAVAALHLVSRYLMFIWPLSPQHQEKRPGRMRGERERFLTDRHQNTAITRLSGIVTRVECRLTTNARSRDSVARDASLGPGRSRFGVETQTVDFRRSLQHRGVPMIRDCLCLRNFPG
jgi:hypothetical protein